MKREITIGGLVTDAEGLGLKAAVHELRAQLADLSPDPPWVVRLGFLAPGFRPPKAPKHPDVFVTSMLPELDHPQDPIGVTEARWREHLGLLQDTGATVFVCTIYRHIGGIADPADRLALLERVRRLNLLAVKLSHELGVGVIDLDRAFAERGAEVLKTDHRLGGRFAAEVAGHCILTALLSLGLDEVMDPALQEAIRARIGGTLDVLDYVRRRLKLPAA